MSKRQIIGNVKRGKRAVTIATRTIITSQNIGGIEDLGRAADSLTQEVKHLQV